MLCPKCNQVVADGARFCGSCGNAIEVVGGSEPTVIRRPASGFAADAPVNGPASPAGASSRPLPGLIERIKNILISPKTEWPVIELEPTSIAQLYTGYVIPLAALAALMSFLRMSVIGINLGFGSVFRTPLLSGVVYALVTFCFALLGLFLVGLIIDVLAPTFSGSRNQRQALKTAAYAFTPAWVSSVFGLLPALGTLLELAAAIYGIYLLYLGLPLLMRSAREKAAGYTAAVVICTILLGVVFGIVSSLTGGFGGYGYGRYGAPHSALTPEQRQERAAIVAGNVIGAALRTAQQGGADLSAAAPTSPPTSSADAAAGAQNAAAATAGLATALGGAMAGSRHVDPVDFHTLKELLPASLPGMQRTAAEGSSQQALGVKESSATGDYQAPGGGARAEIKIADVSAVAGLLDAAGSLVQNRESESDSGYEKNSTIGGRAVHEKYNNTTRHGELSAIVAKRFAVDVTADGVDMSTLEQYVSLVDLARLESLRDSGAQTH